MGISRPVRPTWDSRPFLLCCLAPLCSAMWWIEWGRLYRRLTQRLTSISWWSCKSPIIWTNEKLREKPSFELESKKFKEVIWNIYWRPEGSWEGWWRKRSFITCCPSSWGMKSSKWVIYPFFIICQMFGDLHSILGLNDNSFEILIF